MLQDLFRLLSKSSLDMCFRLQKQPKCKVGIFFYHKCWYLYINACPFSFQYCYHPERSISARWL